MQKAGLSLRFALLKGIRFSLFRQSAVYRKNLTLFSTFLQTAHFPGNAGLKFLPIPGVHDLRTAETPWLCGSWRSLHKIAVPAPGHWDSLTKAGTSHFGRTALGRVLPQAHRFRKRRRKLPKAFLFL